MTAWLGRISKGVKISITQNYAEYKAGGSNKFYRTVVISNSLHPEQQSSVIMNWGAIGTTGQNKVTHAVNVHQAHRNANRKFEEKKGKGYEPVQPPAGRRAGTPGEMNSHIFGNDGLKDEEALAALAKTAGDMSLLEQIFNEIGVFAMEVDPEEAERLKLLEEEKKREVERAEREKLEAIEAARKATYSTAWGEWA